MLSIHEVKTMKREINILRCAAFLFLFFCFAGCASLEENGKAPDEQYNSQVTLFLNGPERTSEHITFELTAVNIIAEDGTSREVLRKPLRVNSLDITNRQVLLGERSIPEGRYRKIQVVIKKASVMRKNRSTDLALPPEGIELPIDVTVKPRKNATLFLNWAPDASISEEYLFKPLFVVKHAIPELRTLMVFVTNEGSGNVSLINRQLGEVVGTVLVGKSPRGIAVNPRKERLKVYVANSGSNSISVIDPITTAVENEVPVRFGKEPVAITVARISAEKDLIFVANYDSNNVSEIDASTLQEMDKIPVGDRPVAIASDPPAETLSDSRFLSNSEINALRNYREKYLNVYVANRNSKSVSVLKINVQNFRCEEVIPLEVQWEPIGLSVDYARGKVYVANYSFDDLSVISIPEIVRRNFAGAVSAIKNVGPSVIGVFADPDFDRIYLLKERSAEIVVMRLLEGFMPAAQPVMPPVMGTIPVGVSPRAFMLDPEGSKIYVVNRGEDSVTVVDKTTKQSERVIPVGKKPFGLDMFSR